MTAHWLTNEGDIMFKNAIKGAVFAASVAAAVPTLAADAEPSEHTLTGNIGFFSQYIFRGLTQTDRGPALQGGFDYAHSSGLYAGTWASNISFLRDANAYTKGGSLEWDFYGGYKMNFLEDFFFDVGALYYYYEGTANPAFAAPYSTTPKANTLELYGALGWKWVSAKFSYSVLDKTFAVKDSDGTYYVDVTANAPIGEWVGLEGLTLLAHVGLQQFSGRDLRNAGGVSNNSLYSYRDYKIGLSYGLPLGFTLGAYYTDTFGLNKAGYGGVNDNPAGPYPRNIGKGTGTVFLQKTF